MMRMEMKMIDELHKEFLIKRAHARTLRHSGRNLFDHLCGTHALLEAWGNAKQVCDAGLFHSIYGTNKFRQKAWPLTDRVTIQLLIGSHAEFLAHMFCVADRPKAFFPEQVEMIEHPLFKQLREIEVANLIEQGSRSRWLHKLRDSKVSDGAKQAIDQHLRRAA